MANPPASIGIPPKGIPVTDPKYSDLVKLGQLPRDVVNVQSCGAVGDGNHDDRPAIQRAIARVAKMGHGTVFFPAGEYYISSALQIASVRVHLQGVGLESRLERAGATGHAIEVSGYGECTVSKLRIASKAQGTSGAAIYVSGAGPTWIADCEIFSFKVGVQLANTTNVHLRGLQIINPSANGYGIIVDGGNEINIADVQIASPYSSTGILLKSDSAVLEGVRVSDFSIIGAGNQGVVITATTYSLNHVHLAHGDIGEQTNESIVIDTAGPSCGDIGIVNVNCLSSAEADGSIYVKANVSRVDIANCSVSANQGVGVRVNGIDCSVIGCAVALNGSGGTFSGLIVGGNSNGTRVMGCRMVSNTNYGIEILAGATGFIVIGNDLRGNTVNPLYNGGSAPKVICDNLGYVTESTGYNSIPNGSTSVTGIAHGLSVTPLARHVSLTQTNGPTNDPGHLWVENIGATTFDLRCRNNPGTSGAGVGWQWSVR